MAQERWGALEDSRWTRPSRLPSLLLRAKQDKLKLRPPGLGKRELVAIQVAFALIELKEAGGGFVDLQGLFVLRAVYGAGKVPIGVEEIGGGAFDSFEAQPLRAIATWTD
jgi:hypothetical protein